MQQSGIEDLSTPNTSISLRYIEATCYRLYPSLRLQSSKLSLIPKLQLSSLYTSACRSLGACATRTRAPAWKSAQISSCFGAYLNGHQSLCRKKNSTQASEIVFIGYHLILCQLSCAIIPIESNLLAIKLA
jgi:hypothetical protein